MTVDTKDVLLTRTREEIRKEARRIRKQSDRRTTLLEALVTDYVSDRVGSARKRNWLWRLLRRQ